ncbi:MAG: excinuclease ABC subunit C [Alphaproteobacteria bacterium CG_4_10_14_0_8_um_filter_53_9]|nr:MAG: excinuclease ABC subunit C [Alphaproteobacteria bacterium CG_4_10_14_0_8_um_filter_53_9]
MFYVYSLQSISHPHKFYIGQTVRWPEDEERLTEHNSGKTAATQERRPWKLVAYFAFTTSSQALAFEVYLKTGSGRAFLKKHFQPE